MRAATAAAAVEAGAEIINDVSAGLADAAMAPIVAETGVHYVAMHWRGHSDRMDALAEYRDVATEVRDELAARVDALVAAGVAPERLILDPGLGFAKRGAQNWELLGRLDVLAELGLPHPGRRLAQAIPRRAAARRRRRRGARPARRRSSARSPRRPGPGACACTTCAARGAPSTSSERGRVDDVARTRGPHHADRRCACARTTASSTSSASRGRSSSIDVSVAVDLVRRGIRRRPRPHRALRRARRGGRRRGRARPGRPHRDGRRAGRGRRARATPRSRRSRSRCTSPRRPSRVPFADVAVTIVRGRA